MEQSFTDNSTVVVIKNSPPAMGEGTCPHGCLNRTDESPDAMGPRNRSVSLSLHAHAPPSKKQRASDDKYEKMGAPSRSLLSCVSSAEAVETVRGMFEARDQVSDETDVPDLEEDEDGDAGACAVSIPRPSFRSPSDSSDEESDVTEEDFRKWLVEQKMAGITASQMLDALGLGVSEGVAVDEDELWEAMLSMGIRLVKPSVTVRCMVIVLMCTRRCVLSVANCFIFVGLQRPREKLDTVNTLQDVAALLRSSKKIVVLAGAGISVSCGIPDFRSENGIYSVRGYSCASLMTTLTLFCD